MDERTHKLIKMWVVNTSLTPWCQIQILWDIHTIVFSKMYYGENGTLNIIDWNMWRVYFIEHREVFKSVHLKNSFINPENPTYENLWHPLYKNNIEQWLLDNDKYFLQVDYCFSCEEVLKKEETNCHYWWHKKCTNEYDFVEIWELIHFLWKDKDWNQNFNLSYSELSEESQDKILDLLLKVEEWKK